MFMNPPLKKLPKKPSRSKLSVRKQAPRMSGRYWRLVVPNLSSYPRNPPRDHTGLLQLKRATVDLLCKYETPRGLTNWCVAWQTHQGSGFPHLDCLFVYSRPVKNRASRYDYLVKHGDLTKYRSVNLAILEYGSKEDPAPISNIGAANKVLQEARVKTDLYVMMQQAMLRDPFAFNAHQWLDAEDLYRAAVRTNLYKAIRTVKDRQQSVCNRQLRDKLGIKRVTRQHIVRCLTAQQLRVYDSWPGYQTIVDHINHISKWGCWRPHKSSNLLVVGRPNTGKTALALKIEQYCPVYYKGVSNWFPSYRSGVYTMTLWNEFTLIGVPYSDILNFLEGTKMDLQYKGGVTCKRDNQLTYMTSNLSLCEHIANRFKSKRNRAYANVNLSARIVEVTIPAHLTLFTLLKLIVPA